MVNHRSVGLNTGHRPRNGYMSIIDLVNTGHRSHGLSGHVIIAQRSLNQSCVIV